MTRNLPEPASSEKHWFALYTKPRWEKKVTTLLHSKGIEVYCPMNKVRKKWSDRYKIIEEPLFKSYLFVRISEEEKSLVRLVDGVVNFVYWLGKPAMVKGEEITRIKKFLNEFSNVRVEPVPDPSPGDRVVITSGVFMDLEGSVVSIDKKRIEIRIDSLGCFLVAQVDKEKVSIK